MNNKGLTVVELIVSFALTVIVSLFLIEIVLILKDTYISVGVRSVLMNKQAIISNRMNQLFMEKTVMNAERCGDNCVKFIFDDMLEEIIYVNTKSNMISIGDYANEFPKTAILGNMTATTIHLENIAEGNYNSILKITIPIEDTLVKNYHFDVEVIYQYDNRKQDWKLTE